MNAARLLFTAGALVACSLSFGQGMLNYVDPSADSARRTRRTNENSGSGANAYTAVGAGARPTATPKASPTPSKTGSSASRSMTSSKAGSTTGTASKTGGPPSPGKPGSKQGSDTASGGFEQKGQLKEVTKQMVESMRTRKVDFDEEEAAADPAVILLNPRKLMPPDQQNVQTDDLARPL